MKKSVVPHMEIRELSAFVACPSSFRQSHPVTIINGETTLYLVKEQEDLRDI